VQNWATKMISDCKGLKYEDRILVTDLTTFEDRRERGDLIQVFKMIKGIDKVDHKKFFKLASTDRTRGHNFKLVKDRSILNIRKYFFSKRVINGWNTLPASVVEAETVNSFKNRYDKYIKEEKGSAF